MSHRFNLQVKRAATLEETRLLVSAAFRMDANPNTWALVANDTDRTHNEAAEADYKRLLKSLSKAETPLNKRRVLDLKLLVKMQRACLEATIEELEIREEIAATQEKLWKAEREVTEEKERLEIKVAEDRKEAQRSQSRLRDAQRKERDIQRELEVIRRRLRSDAEKVVKERKESSDMKLEDEHDKVKK